MVGDDSRGKECGRPLGPGVLSPTTMGKWIPTITCVTLEAESLPEPLERKEAQPTPRFHRVGPWAENPASLCLAFWPAERWANKWLFVYTVKFCDFTQQRKTNKICCAVNRYRLLSRVPHRTAAGRQCSQQRGLSSSPHWGMGRAAQKMYRRVETDSKIACILLSYQCSSLITPVFFFTKRDILSFSQFCSKKHSIREIAFPGLQSLESWYSQGYHQGSPCF